MNPALIKLFWLLNRAGLRRAIRGARTVRGALVLLIALGVIFLWPLVGLFFIFRGDGPNMIQHFGSARPYLSTYMLLMCVLNLLQTSKVPLLYFLPPEVEFLFTAPFHRREILLYKLMTTGVGLVMVALFMATSPILMFLNMWLAAFVGFALAMAMVTLFGIVTRLLGQIVAEGAYNRTRKAILMIVGILVAAGLSQALSRVRGQGVAAIAQSFRLSWPGRVVLAPFEVFSHAILAERLFPDLIGWGAAAAAIDLGLLILVLKLDADYIERAATFSQELYDRVQRMKQTGGFQVSAPGRAVRIRVPRLPWLGGAGPIAWRQMLIILRTSRRVIVSVLSLATIVLTVSAFFAWRNSSSVVLQPLAFVIFGYATFGLSMLPWAFRGDIEHLEVLKTLPVTPLAVTAGELAGSVLVISIVQVGILAISCILGVVAIPVALAVLAFAPPANMLLITSNNLMALLYPVRLISTSPDFQLIGRWILSMMIRMLILVPGVGIPVLFGVFTNLITGLTWLGTLTSWIVLLAELAPLVMLVAWAFRRFDPGTETPAE